MKHIGMAALIVMFSLLLTSHTGSANFSGRTDDKQIFSYASSPSILEQLCENLEAEYLENLKDANSPLTLMGWQLVTNPSSTDKSMNKKVVGTVKNNSKKEFPEVKVEFTVYDEDGNQIAIVSSKHYDFKPNSIWEFNIPVTEDVKKAEFEGLYVLP